MAVTDSMEQAYARLRSVFGYPDFYPLQKEVIAHILDRKDTLVVMPTGGGKSLCYQIPALLFPGLTVVVSPLISLMKDQVEQLSGLGVAACYLNSSLSYPDYLERVDWVRRGEVKLLYLAPETLLAQRTLDLLSTLSVDCLAVDEAHCISEWGHDFRPEYRQIAEVRQRFPQAVCVALTATATPRVRRDIQSSLKLAADGEFIASFNRENLYLEVVPKTDAYRQTVEFIRRFPHQSGIIYCFSRKQVEELAAKLQRDGFSALPYHAGLEDEARRRNQERFIHDDVQIIAATIAFGMGINKPNVRFVVHYDLPKSLESYYQEIGRAGRDHLPAYCRLLYSYGDVQKVRYFIDQKEGVERQVAQSHLEAMIQFAETTTCRRVPLLNHFGEPYPARSCSACDNCRPLLQPLVDLTTPALMFLSCIARTEQQYGADYVIEVLRGSRSQMLAQNGHQDLSTYGIGKELEPAQWQALSRQLIQKGYIAQDGGGVLSLTPAAYQFFKTREPFLGVLEEGRREPAPTPARPTRKEVELQPEAQALFEKLRQKRKELADTLGVPPYAIFPDRTLIEMANVRPSSLHELNRIFGVGEYKRERYGQAFIRVILAEGGAKSRPAAARRKPDKAEKKVPRYVQVAERIKAGKRPEEVMAEFSIQESTLIAHLTQYLMEGGRLPQGDPLPRPALSEALHDRVLQTFAELGPDALKPAFAALDGKVNYNDLSRLRLEYLLLNQADAD